MNTDLYLDRGTFFHRLDPRTKIALVLTIFVVVLYFEHPLWVAPITLLTGLLIVLSQALVNLWRIRYIVIVLTVTGIVIWNFFAHGETHLFWIFSLESLAFSVSRVLVILTAIMGGIFFVSTTRVEEFVAGAIRLGLPYRFGFALSISMRLVPMIIGTVFAIAEAQKTRGLDLDSGNLLQRLRKYVPLLVPVFLSTMRHVNTLGLALEARGFGALPRRSSYLELRLGARDYAVLAASVVLLVALTLAKLAGMGSLPGLIR